MGPVHLAREQETRLKGNHNLQDATNDVNRVGCTSGWLMDLLPVTLGLKRLLP